MRARGITLPLEGSGKNRYYEQVNPFHKTTIGKPKKWLIEAAKTTLKKGMVKGNWQ
jgi:ribonucleotide monophosphatase NagD (HAD superfamily)